MGTRFDDPGSHSRALFERARRVIPGGTSKANFHVRPHPFYLTEGRGCRVTDADGIERLDAINNFTALIHGHAFPPLVDAANAVPRASCRLTASTSGGKACPWISAVKLLIASSRSTPSASVTRQPCPSVR